MALNTADHDEEPEGRQGSSQVHSRVREAILNAELAPGLVMSQVALAEELGVSRTPLREALRLLQGEGLIEAEPNRRVRVAPITASDVEELYALRVTVEAEALRLSMPNIRSEHIARLQGFLAEMDHYAEVKDYTGWTVPHAAFHAQLTGLAGVRFSTLLAQLFDHAERYRRLHIGHGPTAWGADHRGILEAVKAGDADRAAPLLARHFARTAFEVIEFIEPDHEPVRLRQVLADIDGPAA
jgi:GntR family transcriptional regulator, rspAB operon transcriptional repressor